MKFFNVEIKGKCKLQCNFAMSQELKEYGLDDEIIFDYIREDDMVTVTYDSTKHMNQKYVIVQRIVCLETFKNEFIICDGNGVKINLKGESGRVYVLESDIKAAQERIKDIEDVGGKVTITFSRY